MNIKTLITILILNAIIIVLVIGSFKTGHAEAVTPESTKPETVDEDNFAVDSVKVVMDEGLPWNKYLNEVKEGLSYFNPMDIQRLTDDDWRIIISKELDFKDSEYSNRSEKEKETVTGFINPATKVIQIKENTTEENYIRNQTVLCVCQFIDYINGNLSSQEEFVELIVEYHDFVEYKYLNVKVTDENKEQIELPLKSTVDYFAYSMRDYLIYPEYVMEYYPDLFDYFIEHFPHK